MNENFRKEYNQLVELLKELNNGIRRFNERSEQMLKEKGERQGKFLYVHDDAVTAVENILKARGLTSSQWMKLRAPIGSTTVWEYMLGVDESVWASIKADCQNLDQPVSWSEKKPEVVVAL